MMHQQQERSADAQDKPFMLGLDCGEVTLEEIERVGYEQTRAYRRAAAVWEDLVRQIGGRGAWISTRTFMTYGHVYAVAYGKDISETFQVEVFRVMDRFRQLYAASGAVFVCFPQEAADLLFTMRQSIRRRGAPTGHYLTPAGDVGALYLERGKPRIERLDMDPPVTIEPPFQSVPLDLWYLCLDYSQVHDLSEARYLQLQAALKASRSGLGAQRVLIAEHVYLVVLGIDVSGWAKKRFTRLMLDLYQHDRTEFVRLPQAILSAMLFYQQELVVQAQPFVEAHAVSEVDVVDAEAGQIERIAPPVLEDERSLASAVTSKRNTGGGMPSSKKLLLERYYTSRRLRAEVALAGLKHLGAGPAEMRKAAVVERAIVLASQLARYYEFAPSALALVAHLMMQDGEKGSGTRIATLPETHVFMRFTSPIGAGDDAPIHGLFFAEPLRAFKELAARDASTRSVFAADLTREQEGALLWSCSLLRENGSTLLSIQYDATRGLWHLPELHHCPADACVSLPDAPGVRQVCASCQKLLDYFSRWIPIALLAVAGEFASEPEPVLAEVEEEIAYKEQRPGSGRYDEKRVRVKWQVVTFDASLRKRQPVRAEVSERDEPDGPTWLDLAIEKGTVLYVNRRIGQKTRKLDPERNARWKYAREVPVKAHQKRIPMSVERLARLVTRVVASRENDSNSTAGRLETREIPDTLSC